MVEIASPDIFPKFMVTRSRMLQRLILSWLGTVLISSVSSSARGEIDHHCSNAEAGYRAQSNSGRLNGETWTDVTQMADGRYALISAKLSQLAIAESNGLISQSIALPDPYLRPTQVAIQPNGRILVAGVHIQTDGNGTRRYKVQVLAFTKDGVLDQSFASNGVFSYPAITGFVNLAVRCDGMTYLAIDHGYNVLKRLRYEFLVMRLTTDGRLDTAFASEGIASLRVGPTWNSPESLTIRRNGSVLIGGQTHLQGRWEALLFQLDPAGRMDANFGEGRGIMTVRGISKNSSVRSIHLMEDDRLVTAGTDIATQWVTVSRHLPNGRMDLSFGNNGTAYAPTPAIQGQPQLFQANNVYAVDDAEFLVGGKMTSIDGLQTRYLVARLHSNGELNRAFATNGYLSFPLPSPEAGAELIAQNDGSFAVIAEGRQPKVALIQNFTAAGKEAPVEYVEGM
jgi:uncharacterized delta-60 repeat protein